MTSTTPTPGTPEAVQTARTNITNHFQLTGTPTALVICGSGLSQLPDHLDIQATANMADLALPVTTVPGHNPTLHLARTRTGNQILIAAGRVHLYEGRSANEVVTLVRAAGTLGIRTLIVSNAAGSLRPDWTPGTLAVIEDQINLTGHNPLTGPDPTPYGHGRFADMSTIYDPELRQLAHQTDPHLQSGIYAALPGPSYETPAEIRMLRTLGADLVGMSTVLETIAARHLGMRVLGISLTTNLAAGLGGELNHDEVTREGANASHRFSTLVRDILEQL